MQQHIESVLEETRLFQPPKADTTFTSLQDWQDLRSQFDADFEGTWKNLAEHNLQWQKPFTQVLDS
ncbi:MAG: hypothetical protein Q9M19_09100, partial [Mariprofundaceae bacterium]|nr:hypothetical protein [Mariprofundaceae bacterium]